MRRIKNILIVISLLISCCLSAKDNQHVLIIKKIPFTINGKQTELYKITQPDGTWGFFGHEGEIFDTIVRNETEHPTVVHWHGLLVPNKEDGVPYVTQPPIPAHGEYHYHFKLKQSGTYWMHSHHDLQVQQNLSAPFIIYAPGDKKYNKDVVMFLSDFSYLSPEQIFHGLTHAKKETMVMNKAQGHHMMPGQDLVDVQYDAFLTNYKTLEQPEIIKVAPGDTVRLRIIDGAAMTNFFVDPGLLSTAAIAVDGQSIKPLKQNKYQLAVGQRIDLVFTIPAGEGTYPILAHGEGTNMQTGLIFKTRKVKEQAKLPQKISITTPALDYQQELNIVPLHPLKKMQPQQSLLVELEGDMMRYKWTINKQAWPNVKALEIKPQKRIELIFKNMTGMSHPMHLHGHFFQVTEIDGQKLPHGALRDTVLVLPHSTVKVQFDSDNPGNWMMHCHMLYHQESGMMTFINYENVKKPASLTAMPTHSK